MNLPKFQPTKNPDSYQLEEKSPKLNFTTVFKMNSHNDLRKIILSFAKLEY
jgi:hypothetical protein